MSMINVNDLLVSAVTPFEITHSDGHSQTIFQKDLSAGAVLSFVETREGAERNAALLVLVAQAICQEDGSSVFVSEEDLARLEQMPVRIFQQLSDAVVEAAGIKSSDDDDKDEGGEGNS